MSQQIVRKKNTPPKKPNTVDKTVPLLSKDKKKKTPAEISRENGKKGGRPKGKPKSKAGRKMFDGADEDLVVKKLESAFSIGCTDAEACVQADISVRTLYNYQTENPEFVQRKEMLKEKLVLAARNTVSNVIQEKGSENVPTERALKTSQWYLERKRKSEFAPQVNGILDDGKGEGILTREREAEIAAATDKWAGYGKEE